MNAKHTLFESVTLAALSAMSDVALDSLPFGVVGLERNGVVEIYNATEASLAGLKQRNVIGAAFFDAIAQCMNNFMVAQRFEDEPQLDVIIPYVLTLRMRPTPVRLRLLAIPDGQRRYILIER